MSPILANFRRLGLYLLGWTFLAILTADQLATSGGLSWAEAAALSVPLCLIYAFVCLPSWYVCRLTPLRLRSVESLLTIHLAAAVVASVLWIVTARVVATAVSNLRPFAESREHLTKATGLLFGMGVLFYLLTVGMHYVLLAVEASRKSEEREAQAQILAREAELRALKAQVNPHFLYNSLHSISALTTIDPAKAREMCILLGDFLRKTLGLGEKSLIPIEEEIALVDSYLRVEKVRFGKRLEMTEQVDPDALQGTVPPLLLQPMVENAVVHGISNLPEGGWIRLSVKKLQDEIEVVVENKYDSELPPSRRNGVGLANVRRRLEACYGNRAALHLTSNEECFRVSVTLPMDRKAVGVNG
jgi:two-component system, LytTR family, sensor histidine kinase AlgZ